MSESGAGAAPLAGVRVLDISEGVAGPFCAKLLGDLGADVVKVERPGTGDEARALGPFPASAQDPETRRESSATFFFFNTSKRSVALAVDSAAGREQLARLVQRYDVVIAGQTAEELDAAGIGYQALRDMESGRDPHHGLRLRFVWPAVAL